MTDYERMQERDKAKKDEMNALFLSIAGLMPGWTIKANENPESDSHFRNVLVKGDLQIHFARESGGKQDKVNIQTWAWPGYNYVDRGEVRKAMVTPRDLYDPKEESPSISCSISRGAEAIVKDINRRFLSDYERIFARCVEKAKQSGDYAAKIKGDWEAICAVLDVSPLRDSHYPKTTIGEYNFQVTNRNGKAHLELDVNAVQLKQILDALKRPSNLRMGI